MCAQPVMSVPLGWQMSEQLYDYVRTVLPPGHKRDVSNPVAFDMAMLSLCNHTIISAGTFGFWGSYLSGKKCTHSDSSRSLSSMS